MTQFQAQFSICNLLVAHSLASLSRELEITSQPTYPLRDHIKESDGSTLVRVEIGLGRDCIFLVHKFMGLSKFQMMS
jgi:hypothetical protein